MLTALRHACQAHLMQAEALRKPALRRTGTILFEVGYDQAEDVAAILSQCGYHNITRHKDYNGILRGVEATL